MSELRELLDASAAQVADYRKRTDELTVFPTVNLGDVRAALGSLRDGPTPAGTVIDELVEIIEPANATPSTLMKVSASKMLM